MDVFDFLEQVRQRPTLFVGESNDERYKQLGNLEHVLYGYEVALRNHQIRERVPELTRDFMRYLHDRFGWSMACGPSAAIRGAVSSDEEAWETFWRSWPSFERPSKQHRAEVARLPHPPR